MEKDTPSSFKDIPPIKSYDLGKKGVIENIIENGVNEAKAFGQGLLERIATVENFFIGSALDQAKEKEKINKEKAEVCQDGGLDYIGKMVTKHQLEITPEAANIAAGIVCNVKHDEITVPPVPGSISEPNGRE